MPIQLTGKSFRNFASAVLAVLALTIVCQAQDVASQKNSTIKIKNFGQMDGRFYRGAQPKKEDYKDLAALGIKTVIDLRDDPTDYERPLVESLGMKYVNIPMMAKQYPTEITTRMFLRVVSDPATGKFFVHCAGGRHRTGAMGAVYRFQFNNWNFDQVYSEMKKYDFYTSWGHGAFKDFVRDYYDKMHAAKLAPSSSSRTGSTIHQ
ncbi:MAG TPA: tyrosine-protein phosphatase [Pyrinomonadaceae bacterium]|nr:tyrosine-protein phosphatase [Pyrinomonadaceae bacterium]